VRVISTTYTEEIIEEPAEKPRPRQARKKTPRSGGAPLVGLMADAGLPDGMMASLVLRPVEALRLHAGAGSNTASAGFRGGLTLLPFGAGPSLSGEIGRYLEGETNGVVRTFFGGVGKLAQYFQRMQYSFASAHAGLDFGKTWGTFFIHAGVSYVKASLTNVAPIAEMTGATGVRTTVSINQPPVLRLWSPSVKLGLIVYLQ
jgi:hypothetical protein